MLIRCRQTHNCLSSKAASLILFWSFAIGLWYGLAFNPDLLSNFGPTDALSGYGCEAAVLCFFPLASFLADVKYGRYKTIVKSLLVVLISILSLTLLLSMSVVTYLCCIPSVAAIVLSSVMLFLVPVAFIFSYVGLAGFTASVVQFGMDQLHDSPGEDRTLFIHWYVWVHYVTIVIGQLSWSLADRYNIGCTILASIYFSVVALLIISMCLARRRRNWFLIEPGRVNPYKLVYRVTKFAHQHKTPVRRSAFTYCEDEIPRGLDLGKEKYGGSFTTEQVEDVKVFYEILKVLFSFGAVFFLGLCSKFRRATLCSPHCSLLQFYYR